MITTYESLFNGEYPIPVKTMRPEEIKGVIVGVHGFAGDKESSCLDFLAQDLEKYGYGVVCFDFPGHGISEADDDTLTLDNCQRDLIFILREVERRYPESDKVIFATSFGAFVSLLPEEESVGWKLIMRSPAVTMGEHTLLDFLGVSEEELKEMGSVSCGYERKMKVTYEFCRQMKEASIYSRSFKRNGLIIHGSEDDAIPLHDIEHFLTYNPQFELKIVEGADHRYKHPGDLKKISEYVKDYISQK